MNTLRVALAAQIVFFAGWATYLFHSHADAREVWVETAPVDPRDWISGQYVALVFPRIEGVPVVFVDGHRSPCEVAVPVLFIEEGQTLSTGSSGRQRVCKGGGGASERNEGGQGDGSGHRRTS